MFASWLIPGSHLSQHLFFFLVVFSETYPTKCQAAHSVCEWWCVFSGVSVWAELISYTELRHSPDGNSCLFFSIWNIVFKWKWLVWIMFKTSMMFQYSIKGKRHVDVQETSSGLHPGVKDFCTSSAFHFTCLFLHHWNERTHSAEECIGWRVECITDCPHIFRLMSASLWPCATGRCHVVVLKCKSGPPCQVVQDDLKAAAVQMLQSCSCLFINVTVTEIYYCDFHWERLKATVCISAV